MVDAVKPAQVAPTYRAAPVAAFVLLLAILAGNESGGRHYGTPYRDPAGILTVCDGITGPDVVEGRTYTRDDCARLGERYVARMYARVGPRCMGSQPLTLSEWLAWGDFAYNVGDSAFCNSTAARLIREGKRREACAEQSKWRFVTINGKRRDCALPEWRSKCGGIVDRRARMRAMCEREL